MRWRAALATTAVVAATLTASAVATPTSDRVHFVAAGDFSQSFTTTSPVLQAMSAAGPDLALALGDLSYGAVGQEQSWCDFVTNRVGAGFPFQLLAGNHESSGQNGHINDFSACLPNQLPGLRGTYGRQWSVDVPQQDPLIRFVMISPGIPYLDGTWSYAAGTPRYEWTRARIDEARADGIPYVVVGMHKPCLSTGEYACDPGADITNLLVNRKVDLVLSGHEHLYQRTKQVAHGPGCPAIVPGTYDADCVVDADNALVAGAGTVFMTIGSGGVGLRANHPTDPEAPWFVSTMALDQNPTHGFADFDATPAGITVSFVRGAGGTFGDSFTLARPPDVPNSPPVPAFTSSSQGLTASLDASDSFDPDGSVASYSWTFGDGASGTGRTTQRTFAQAGTYTVTLTVTDDDGATASTSSQVTVTGGGQAQVLASDDFERTTTGGWGAAPTGGAWTVSSASASSVSSGKGRLTLATPGRSMTTYLNGVSSSDVDVQHELSVDKRPAGTSGRLDSSTIVRRTTGGQYLAVVKVYSSGQVRAGFTAVAGAQTAVGAQVTVSGLTYNTGDTLLVRAQAVGTSPTQLRLKVWKSGMTEPTSWLVSPSDATSGLQSAGSVGFTPYLGGATTNAPLEVRYDGFRAVTASTLP
jgi:PKD repeat protein